MQTNKGKSRKAFRAGTVFAAVLAVLGSNMILPSKVYYAEEWNATHASGEEPGWTTYYSESYNGYYGEYDDYDDDDYDDNWDYVLPQENINYEFVEPAPADPVDGTTAPYSEVPAENVPVENVPVETETNPASSPAPSATPSPSHITIPENAVFIDAPYISQAGNWVTGCESVSATMLLQFLGMDITVDQFIFGYLDMKPVAIRTDGSLVAPNPNYHFAGSPYSEHSFGCYAAVIKKALTGALETFASEAGEAFEVKDLSNVPMEDLCKEYLDAGLPVVFWATIGMKPSNMGPSWLVPDTGETFSWLEGEHCMLLVGYDDTNYYFNDPDNNNGVTAYEKNLVETRHKEQYSMAVGVIPHGGK